MRHPLLALAVVAALAARPMPMRAQGDARLIVTLPQPGAWSREAPFISSTRMLRDQRVRELLHSGFPARLHFRLELWSASGLFDALKEQEEWDVIVRYNPLERRYSAARIERDRATPLGTFRELSQVEDAISRPFQPAIRAPTRHDKFYYAVVLDEEMLSVSDLDEVERWLHGELTPALSGERNAGTAIGRGAKTLITKLLGGEDRHYEARSNVFRP